MAKIPHVTSLRRALLALASLLLVVIGGSAASAAGAVTDPVNGPYAEVHGEQVTGIPTTPSCTDTITSDYDFHNTAYGSDPPFTGDYVPTCAGPWSKVVLTMSVTVRTGTQFDRIGDVLIGGVELLHPTTAEGESGSTTWSIQRVVSQYATLFASTQPTYFIIGNQTDGTYTGDFYGTLALTFYGVGAGAPQAQAADAVFPISSLDPAGRGLPTRSGDQPLTSTATIPANTTALTAEIFASGHGAEEEDWWNAPFTCASGGIPYREVSISVDGALAGTAPIFPTIYTGGYGPDFWRPFPSPRAYNLRPYSFDLTPFIGQLTDGTAHSFAIAMIGQGGCDGYWYLGGNLLATTNRAGTGRTTGSITSNAAPALPTNTSTTGTNQSNTASDVTTSAHHLDTVGTIRPAGAAAPTTVHVVQDLTNSATDAALDVNSSWTWASSSTDTTGASTAVTSQRSTYQLVRTGPSWTLVDDQTTKSTANGATTHTSTLTDTMSTVGAVVGVTGAGNTSSESWKYSTSDGVCVDHELVGAAQITVSDTTTLLPTDTCDAVIASAPTPTPTLPEAPVALLVPLAGLAVLGALAVRRRRVS